MHKAIRRRGRTAAVACLLAIATVMTPAIAGMRTANFHLTPELVLKKIRASKGPQQIRVLNLTPGANVPDIAPATQQYPMWSHTSTMAAAAGAIAAINGDYGLDGGRPKHTLMIDGELWTTGKSAGVDVAWSANGKSAYIGHPELKILATDVNQTKGFFVRGWNEGAPTGDGIQGYTARGGAVTRPPGATNPQPTSPSYCAARLVPLTPIGWSGGKRTSIVRQYTVDAQPEPCPQTPLGLGSAAGAVVVASRSRSTLAHKIVGLQPGDTVKLSFTFVGWPGVTDVMGGSELLVKKGTNVAPPYRPGDNYVFNYNPRTAVGITQGCSDTDPTTTCRLIFITIDGRQTNWSYGVRFPYLADKLIHLGASRAVNLDGGGSTTMWVKKRNTAYCESTPSVGGCLVQRPSDSTGERSKQSAIVVLPSGDAGTPAGLR